MFKNWGGEMLTIVLPLSTFTHRSRLNLLTYADGMVPYFRGAPRTHPTWVFYSRGAAQIFLLRFPPVSFPSTAWLLRVLPLSPHL